MDKEYKEIVDKLVQGLNQMGLHGTVIGAIALPDGKDGADLYDLEAFRKALEAGIVDGEVVEIENGEDDL